MTVKEFRDWCERYEVPDDARILLNHPGGFDNFDPYEYDSDEDIVIAEGTG